MSTGEGSLARFYDGWDVYQGLLVEAVGGLTAEQLALQAAPSLRPAWVLAAHIVSARAYWFHRVMGEGGADLAAFIPWDDDGEPRRSGAELAHGLAATWRTIAVCLARWTPAMLDDRFTTPRGYQFTRQWGIWQVMETQSRRAARRRRWRSRSAPARQPGRAGL